MKARLDHLRHKLGAQNNDQNPQKQIKEAFDG